MTAEKKLSKLERVRQKAKLAQAELRQLEARERERQKTEQRRLEQRFGEIAVKALKDGAISPSQWEVWCRTYLKSERQQESAIAGMWELLNPAEAETETAAAQIANLKPADKQRDRAAPVSKTDPVTHNDAQDIEQGGTQKRKRGLFG